jgi:hypothetical protein
LQRAQGRLGTLELEDVCVAILSPVQAQPNTEYVDPLSVQVSTLILRRRIGRQVWGDRFIT